MRLLILAVLFITIGCGTKPTMEMELNLAKSNNGRFKVTRVAVFKDDLAYNSRRGIYVLQDSSNGKEYIGVSGIGVSELGQHSTTTTDHEGNPTTHFEDDER